MSTWKWLHFFRVDLRINRCHLTLLAKITSRLQEKPTNCGTKAADVPDECLGGKHNANPLTILAHLQLPQRGNEFMSHDYTTPIIWKCCSICHRLVVIWRWSIEIPNFGVLTECLGSWFSPIKSPSTTSQYLSIQSFAVSAAVWPTFQSKNVPPPVCGVRVSLRGLKWYQSKCRPPHSNLTSMHTIGRLCYSIGGVKIAFGLCHDGMGRLSW